VPPLSSSGNLYSEAGAGKVSPEVAGALPRVYVPNHASGSVTVIDPESFRVVGSFAAAGDRSMSCHLGIFKRFGSPTTATGDDWEVRHPKS
jgi:hypothetical protein